MSVETVKSSLANGEVATIIKQFVVPNILEGEHHSGVDVKVPGDVYSICAGVVTGCGMDYQGKYAVTVEYDAQTSFRYMHLASCSVKLGERVRGGDVIGTPDKHVHFEACKVPSDVRGMKFPTRVGNRTYDKIDPIEYVRSSSKLYQGPAMSDTDSDEGA